MASNVNVDLLSWVKAEIDHDLNIVRERFAGFLAKSDDPAPLRDCEARLHHVSGALNMIRLEGPARVCAATERAFAQALADTNGPKAAILIIDRAISSLRQFLDELASGEPSVPLKLLPQYREVMALMGKSDAAEKDLFFPDLSIEAPADSTRPAVPVADTDLKPYLLAQRVRFQRGMLAWLRNAADRNGPHEMQLALAAIHGVSRQLPGPQAIWWAAIGLIDGLILSDQPAWIAGAKPLCGRIDIRLRDLTAGTASDDATLTGDILYAIATCKASTQRIKEVRQLFKLDGQFPEPMLPDLLEFDMDRLQPMFADVRARLDAAKNVWVQYTAGEKIALPRFRELVTTLRAKADELGNQQLVRLFDAVAFIATRLPDPYPAHQQVMIVEMAAAFLLSEHIIETFTTPLPDLDQQVTVMAGWLLDAAKGKTRSGEPPAGLRADLTQQIGEIQLRAQVAKEILANLDLIEQGLDAYARDPSKLKSVQPLGPLMKQIHGALAILRIPRAARLLKVCHKLIVEGIKPDNPNRAEDMDWIAEGLSSLGLFLEPMLRGRPPSPQVIETFLTRLEKRKGAVATAPQATERKPQAPATPPATGPVATAETSPVTAEPPAIIAPAMGDTAPAQIETAAQAAAPAADQDAVTAAPVAPSTPATADQPVDPELLAIYLEEADEVLAAIGAALEKCRAQPENLEALTTIRRGFHTLKGSGRMVGLNELGEIAWEIEQLHNHWLELGKPATPGLIDFIARTSESFANWIGQLKSGTPATIDGREIVARARALKSGADTGTAAVPAPQPAEIAIGDLRMARGFYEIYLKEVSQRVATLEQEFAAWRSAPNQAVTHEFIRAAHTLTGISRSAGIVDIAELGSTLEQWLPCAARVSHDAQVQTVAAAIAKLRAMIDDVARQDAPQSATVEDQNLRRLVGELQATVPQVESTAAKTGATPVSELSATPAAQPATAVPANTQADAIALGKAIAAAKAKDQRVIRDDIDPEILIIFLEEAETLLPLIGHDLREWKSHPDNYQLCHALQRSLHTLKGSARMAGAMRLGELIHGMESKVEVALTAETLPPTLFEELEAEMDRLSENLERIQHPPTVAKDESQAPVTAETVRKVEAPFAGPVAMLRINADTLDRLINESSEISIARSRFESELRTVKQSLTDLNDSVRRLRNQLRDVELQADSQMQSRRSLFDEKDQAFDPLEFDRYTQLQELTRMMAESLHDVTSIQQNLAKTIGDADAAVMHQSRINRGLQQELMRMRTVPFATLGERLYRTLRQIARELDKKANLEIEGGQVELDRSVLEKIGAPLEHMLRNSLAHGIESAAERTRAGKREIGEIKIALRQEGNEIVILMSDDGGGIDLDKLRRKAVEKGLLADGQEIRDSELLQFIFASGLSTSEEVTELAGRGVGMDVVRNEIAALGGRVEVATNRGKDTTFTIFLPLTLAVTQAVLVRVGAEFYAIPSAMVVQVLKVKPDALARHYKTGAIEAQGMIHPLHYLGRLLRKTGAVVDANNQNAVLLLRSGIQHMALHVDELLKNQEIVVKNLGVQLSRVVGIAGATVLGDGRIVMIINPVLLSQRATPIAVAEPTAQIIVGKLTAPTVMVVDDSLTVRKITSKLLEREGYRVTTAKDGIDALEQIKEALPDVMLVDIEMPRMNGFDLAKSIRNDQRTRNIPIIIISSRTAEKHRNHAFECGVNDFLGKPYQEADLLSHIEALLPRKKNALLNAEPAVH